MKTAWAVIVNADLTEGRGPNVISHLCEKMTTAIRLAKGASVQGCNGGIEEVDLLEHNGMLYGPVRLVQPTAEDDREQEKADTARAQADRRREAEVHAKELGLTDEDIEALR